MQQKTALVTGAARRIGRAIALRLAQEGYGVVLHCHRSAAEGEELATAIRLAGGRAAVVTADLADGLQTAALIARAAEVAGPLSLLVNNASAFEPDAARAFSAEVLDLQMAVNLRAPLILSRDFAEHCGAREGAIVNILDQRVLMPTPEFFTYTVSKSALWTATRTMAQSFAPHLRVNAVGPGPTLPSIWEGEEGLERERSSVPLQRGPQPEEIAEAVVFLAAARNVTGQMIAVDGGQHIMWPPYGQA